MNLDINYFATYEEQKLLLKHLIDTNCLFVYIWGARKNKNDFLVKSIDQELRKSYRKANIQNQYFLSFDNKTSIKERLDSSENEKIYTLAPSDINCNGIDVKACSYEDNMILFGRISTIFVNDKKIEAFKELKKFMRGKYKKKGRWYVSNSIVDNKNDYRLLTVIGDSHPKEFDLKVD
ncbi:MAG: hypothetical protein J6P12_06755 [Methanobrevibacter sp.]|nr:hypothetical protein [Methanobrevibacter sp.]